MTSDLNNFLAGNIVMEGTGSGEKKDKKDFSYVNFLLELLGMFIVHICVIYIYIHILIYICS
jgi:hypothetical protein